MKHFYDSESFFNKIMEETYSALPAPETSRESGQLLDYFNEKSIKVSKNKCLEDLFIESGSEFYELDYVEQTGCYHIEEFNLDLPSNWSIFKTIKVSQSKKLSLVLNINEFEEDSIYQIFKRFFTFEAKLYFVVSLEGSYVVFPRMENVTFEDVINKYLSLANKTEVDINISIAA